MYFRITIMYCFNAVDIDECELGTSGCQQRCTNEVGTFVCSCNDGYEIDKDKLKCYESASYSLQVTLDMDVSGKNLKEQQGKAYLELKGLLEPVLKEKIQAEVQGLRDVFITKLRHGSVIVDLSVIIDIVTSPNASSKMVEAIMKIAQEGLLVNGTHYKAEVKVGNITVPPILEKCTILNAIENCTSDTYCSINKDGEAYCGEALIKRY
ncbi:unnamed protein product [Lymnaea stagnalis]|uniref:EGF-like calcium-binding domain-containing protein n=1 Tax=Lymnaea stagnalis TaxID=6523 RepID=A0AAV2IN01_LYMST